MRRRKDHGVTSIYKGIVLAIVIGAFLLLFPQLPLDMTREHGVLFIAGLFLLVIAFVVHLFTID